MYTLNYYVEKTKGSEVFQNEYVSEEFRLRKDAIQYLLKIVRKDYEECGYTTRVRVGGIHCYKSKITEKGENVIEDVIIRVEKA